MRALRANWLRILIHVGALTPLARLAWSYWQGLFFDPIRQITSSTGKTALVLLMLSLACTPITPSLALSEYYASAARWGFMPSCTPAYTV